MLHEATDSTPDQVVALLAVCQDAKEYPTARGLLRRAIDPATGTCEPSTRLYNALLRVCAATNNAAEAELHFLEMLAGGEACRPDTETLNCLLKVFTKTHKVLKCLQVLLRSVFVPLVFLLVFLLPPPVVASFTRFLLFRSLSLLLFGSKLTH